MVAPTRTAPESPDVVIVGDGVSALLLAESLIRRDGYRSLRLIAPRRAPRARRFGFWSDGPTPFDAHVDASFRELRVTDASARHTAVALSRLTYRSFSAQRWWADTLARVCSAPRVEYVEAQAEQISQTETRARVETAEAHFDADWVFSSGRLTAPPERWQRFMGWEIELDEAPPADLGATLLDFRTPSAGDFRFMYQLPLAPRRLFVEHVSYEPCDHAALLHAYVEQVLGLRRYRVIDREQGATPLFRERPVRRTGRVIEIGVAGGLAKAATGYAITRMWRDAEAIAESLVRHGEPLASARPPLLGRLADRFFLDLLAHAPARLPLLMSALFSRAHGDAVLAFLDDRARWAQKLAVALAMPGWLRWWLWRQL